MKGLLKYLSPFAPDQSGAASVLYDLGGITVICDAGGCTGNICGFDEPRWFDHKSAIFSAGLRDMDAILGRDDRLIAKLKDTAQKVDAHFAAIIGTPVPAVIATDYKALRRMAEKRCNLPVITIECTGTRLYDEGEEETYLELFRRFAEDNVSSVPTSAGTETSATVPTDKASTDSADADTDKDIQNHKLINPRKIGVIGATPLDLSSIHADRQIRKALQKDGWDEICCYGMGDGLDAIRQAGSATENLVLSPAGLKAAEYLKERFGTPYRTAYPLLQEDFKAKLHTLAGKNVLIIHQQVAANEIRREIRRDTRSDSPDIARTAALAGHDPCGQITAATWFLQKDILKEPQDFHLTSEDQFIEQVEKGGYDVIIGDRLLKRALKNFKGEYIHIPHFAMSGNCG